MLSSSDLKRLAKAALGASRWPPARWGNLRRMQPLSRNFGESRGGAVDRYYIERFLSENDSLIRGRTLEVKDSGYAMRFGGRRVTRCDVLDINAANPQATIIADLGAPSSLPDATFDCIILTQTLQYVWNLENAIRSLWSTLRPGGVLLISVPGITPVRANMSWYWNFTGESIARLLAASFLQKDIKVRQHGNLVTAVAFLEGIGAPELKQWELDEPSPDFPVVITAIARKAG